MGLASVSVLAVGLAMDATAAAAARGAVTGRDDRRRGAARVALLFGGFQGLMPLAGWLVGDRFGERVAAWDHWIAFGLLAAIGGRMIVEGLRRGDDRPVEGDPIAWRLLLLLALATSIDAMAAGLTLPLLGAPPVVSVSIIAGVTALMSATAFLLGESVGRRRGRWIEVVGGLLLIGVGVRVLVAHLA